MALLSFTQFAAPGTVFAAGLFDARTGRAFPFADGSSTVEAVLVSAVVSPDGASVEITLDVPADGISLEGGGS